MRILRIALGSVLAIISLTVFVTCGQSDQKADREPIAEQESPTLDSLTIELTGIDSVSVFEILEQIHDVDYQSSAMGIFVKGIDSIYANDQYFWVYSVNDTMAQTAADKYITSDRDRIIWHFRRLGD